MALDRWIALIILLICLVYGYTAYFVMDAALPPFMRNSAILPSTFPKVLSAMAILCTLVILLGLENGSGKETPPEINYRRLTDYKLGQALSLLGLMVAYALLLRPAGFLASTVGFLVIGGMILGERKLRFLIPVAIVAATLVWYLVQQVLGIFLRPWPFFIGVGG